MKISKQVNKQTWKTAQPPNSFPHTLLHDELCLGQTGFLLTLPHKILIPDLAFVPGFSFSKFCLCGLSSRLILII